MTPRRVLVLALPLTVAALWPASRLAIEADPMALMPSGSPAATDYRVFLERFGGLEKVFVLLVAPGADSEADLVAASDRLAARLERSSEVAAARAGLEQDDLDFIRSWVAPRAPLLLGADWRRRVEARIAPEAIRARVQRLRRGTLGPPGASGVPWLAADPLGFTDDLPALSSPSGGLSADPFTGAFVTPDGDTALIVVTPARAEIDPEGGEALALELRRAFDETRRDHPGLEMLAVGGPLYAAEDERRIRSEVRGSLIASALGCTLLLVAVLGGLRLPMAVVAGVAAGLIWTAAGLSLWMGSVSAAALGFSAVLIGLGIDYGIHGAARFRQRRLAGEPPATALAEAIRSSRAGIVTSALTTAGALAVLGAAHFRPLRELGAMVALGIVCIVLTSLGIGAPLAVAFDDRGRTARAGRLWRWLETSIDAVTGLAARHALASLSVVGVLSALSLWGMTRLSLDPDLRTFRSSAHSAHAAEAMLAERFGIGLDTTTVVLSGGQLPDVLARADRVHELLVDAAGADASVASPTDWLGGAGTVTERLAELERMPLAAAVESLVEQLEQAGLSPAYFRPGVEALRTLGAGRDPGVPPPSAWPDWLRELVRVAPDEAHAALKLRLPEGRWPDGPPAELVERIRALGGHVASAPRIGLELRALAAGDLRSLAGLALAVVAIVLLVSFRGRIGYSLLALTPVVFGAIWSLGLWGAAGRALDLGSLAVLPIVLGIGLDDGLHALHAARRRRGAGLGAAVREVGPAMVLTTATTCLAFGSLVLTTVPGLRAAGVLVTAGVLGCLGATLVLIPAVGALLERRSAPDAV